ncbi:MAG TPA: dienelactone hydrolase family protein [Methylovirgula sp.]|nr:dienelactone hydrolase family protein [Methylovirgula sp.]
MVSNLDGPRLTPKGRVPRQLVVFLHGYGADGNDLIAVGQQWQVLLPDAVFIAPHAPEACAQAPVGRQWFALDLRNEQELWRGVTGAMPKLNAFLDAELARYGVSEDRLALVGFSQGTMMALHAGLRRRVAALVGYSGLLVGGEHLAQAQGKPSPILLLHGDQDDLIPAEALFVAAEQLAKAGIPCQWHLSFGIGHGIDAGGLMHGGLFLAQAFGIKLPEGFSGATNVV